LDDKHEQPDNGVLLEKVNKFSYLGDMLDANGGCTSGVTWLGNIKEWTRLALDQSLRKVGGTEHISKLLVQCDQLSE